MNLNEPWQANLHWTALKAAIEGLSRERWYGPQDAARRAYELADAVVEQALTRAAQKEVDKLEAVKH